ncbi:uncharacterized protein LOC121684853 isoform X2 [Alosa sapidissima]|uniref:uncharacterized protein LOC121684853 isoform X2 n=1 Tax=Alosa sapidissima TaxID=34773 RepID=UPI001C082818|nr:uncharacterized protein LOC121684853 isoform X2 [Alosa sapidissima]
MWFCWLLAYRLEKLKRELEALGVNVDGHGQNMDENKNKKTKKELQKLLIKELKQVEDGRTGLDKKARERAEGLTLPMEIPDVLNVIHDLDAFLDKELEDSERNEQRDDDVKAVLDSLLDKEDSTLASEGLKDKGEKERVLRPEVGDRKEEAEREANFWSARENHKGSVPRRRFQGGAETAADG